MNVPQSTPRPRPDNATPWRDAVAFSGPREVADALALAEMNDAQSAYFDALVAAHGLRVVARRFAVQLLATFAQRVVALAHHDHQAAVEAVLPRRLARAVVRSAAQTLRAKRITATLTRHALSNGWAAIRLAETGAAA